jgi:hypothetical protein
MKNAKKILILTVLTFLFLSGAGCYKATPAIQEFDFEKTGNITKDNPGMETGIWNLIWEEPGAPALSVSLVFNENSICVKDDIEKPCVPDKFTQGARTKIIGKNKEGVVSVNKMWILK